MGYCYTEQEGYGGRVVDYVKVETVEEDDRGPRMVLTYRGRPVPQSISYALTGRESYVAEEFIIQELLLWARSQGLPICPEDEDCYLSDPIIKTSKF